MPSLRGDPAGPSGRRVPRALHPLAWWGWAAGLAVAVSRTTNPLLLLLVLGVLGFVVTARRTDAPWARGFKYYLWFALGVIALRVIFRSLFTSGAGPSDHVLFRLPQVGAPHWYAGVQFGGPVSVEAVLSAALDGLRLACLLCCIGAANTLANPKRALRVLPGALYELGIAVTVSITIAPQLVESVQRVRRARRLRAGRTSGFRALRSVAIPVLEDALERSLRLAAAMDSRGYGRSAGASQATRRVTGVVLLAGMLGLCIGAYGLYDPTAPAQLGLPALLAGSALCCAGLAIGSRRIRRTSYRPDPWQWPEWLVTGCGLLSAGLLLVSAHEDPAPLNPSLQPLSWPTLPLLPALAICLAALAGFAAPPPATRSGAEPAASSRQRTPVPL